MVGNRFLVETKDGMLFVIETLPKNAEIHIRESPNHASDHHAGFTILDPDTGSPGRILGSAFRSEADPNLFMLRFKNQNKLIESRLV